MVVKINNKTNVQIIKTSLIKSMFVNKQTSKNNQTFQTEKLGMKTEKQHLRLSTSLTLDEVWRRRVVPEVAGEILYLSYASKMVLGHCLSNCDNNVWFYLKQWIFKQNKSIYFKSIKDHILKVHSKIFFLSKWKSKKFLNILICKNNIWIF